MRQLNSWLASGLATLAVVGAVAAMAGEVVTQAQIEAATTAEQHKAIALSYDEEAAASESRAESHAKMAKTYRSAFKKSPGGASMANHCGKLEQAYRSAADEYRSLAAEHREMAAAAK